MFTANESRDLVAYLQINCKRHPLYKGHNLIGRCEKATVILRDIRASQMQAIITILNNQIFVSDMQSSNSTKIEEQVLSPWVLYEIQDKCRLRFGEICAVLNTSMQDTSRLEIDEEVSQLDPAIFGVSTQLNVDDTNETDPVLPSIPENADQIQINEMNTSIPDEHDFILPSVPKVDLGFTQIFMDTRNAFKPPESQQTCSIAMCDPDSDSENEEPVTVLPTQDFSDNKECLSQKDSPNVVTATKYELDTSTRNTSTLEHSVNVENDENEKENRSLSGNRKYGANSENADTDSKDNHFEEADNKCQDNEDLDSEHYTPKSSPKHDIHSNSDTDLDESIRNKTLSQDSELFKCKRKDKSRLIASDSDSDTEDNSRFGSRNKHLRIIESCGYNSDSNPDSLVESMSFDINDKVEDINSNEGINLTKEIKENINQDEGKYQQIPVTCENNWDDVVSDSDTETQDNVVIKLYEESDKKNQSRYKWTGSRTNNNQEKSIEIPNASEKEKSLDEGNVSVDPVNDLDSNNDASKLYADVSKDVHQELNETDTNYEDVSFIPATQALDSSTIVTVNKPVLTEDKDSQGSFHLGLTEYIKESQPDTKLVQKELGNENNMMNPTDELKEEISKESKLIKDIDEDNDIFLVPTQKFGFHNENEVRILKKGTPNIFSQPTQQISNVYDSMSINEIEVVTTTIRTDKDTDNDIFLVPTQPVVSEEKCTNSSDVDNIDDSVFNQATQKISNNSNNENINIAEDVHANNEDHIFLVPTQRYGLSENLDKGENIDDAIFNKPTQISLSDNDQNTSRNINITENRPSGNVFVISTNTDQLEHSIFDQATQIVSNVHTQATDSEIFKSPRHILSHNDKLEELTRISSVGQDDAVIAVTIQESEIVISVCDTDNDDGRGQADNAMDDVTLQTEEHQNDELDDQSFKVNNKKIEDTTESNKNLMNIPNDAQNKVNINVDLSTCNKDKVSKGMSKHNNARSIKELFEEQTQDNAIDDQDKSKTDVSSPDHNVPMFSTQEVFEVLVSNDDNGESKSSNPPKPTSTKPLDTVQSKKENHESLMPSQYKDNLNTGVSEIKQGDSIFSTQEVFDVLASNDCDSKPSHSKSKKIDLNEKDVSLDESIFLKETRKLSSNLQSTLLDEPSTYAGTMIKDNQFDDDDFEFTLVKNKKKTIAHVSTSKDDAISYDSGQRQVHSLEVNKKSRKRVRIQDLVQLDKFYALADEDETSSNSNVKNLKSCLTSADVAKDKSSIGKAPSYKMKQRNSKKCNIKTDSTPVETPITTKTTQAQPVSAKSKKVATATRTTRSTKQIETIPEQETEQESELQIKAPLKRGRPLKIKAISTNNNDTSDLINNNNNNNNNNIDYTAIPSCSTDNDANAVVINTPVKRGRPKRNVCKPDVSEVIATPKVIRTATRKETKITNDVPISNSTSQATEVAKSVPIKKRKKVDLVASEASGSLTPQMPAKRTRGDSEASLVESPLSQRSKRQIKPKVVFTMLNSPELESIVRSLGGTIVDTVEACTVLVTPAVKRSEKLLAAIGLGKAICSDSWLRECKKENRFLDPWSNIYRDPEAEGKWNFSLEESLERSQNIKLMANYTMLLLVNTAQDILKKSIECTGGKCIHNTRSMPDDLVIVSTAENRKKYEKYVSEDKNIMVVEPEAIFDAVLRQEIRFDNFKIA